jgi:hypothetical protein
MISKTKHTIMIVPVIVFHFLCLYPLGSLGQHVFHVKFEDGHPSFQPARLSANVGDVINFRGLENGCKLQSSDACAGAATAPVEDEFLVTTTRQTVFFCENRAQQICEPDNMFVLNPSREPSSFIGSSSKVPWITPTTGTSSAIPSTTPSMQSSEIIFIQPLVGASSVALEPTAITTTQVYRTTLVLTSTTSNPETALGPTRESEDAVFTSTAVVVNGIGPLVFVIAICTAVFVLL